MINFAFFGTPELTRTILDSLKQAGLVPSLVVTTPDRPKGRKLVLTPSPAKLWAIENGIPYLQPEKIDESFVAALKAKKFDLFVVVAYGKILPDELIHTPKHGTINVHYSLLPKYRGATPVESALLNGDESTGVCIQKMQFKLDTGPVIALEEMPIPKDITAPSLRDKLNERAASILPSVIEKYVAGKIIPTPQDEKLASGSKKIKKEDGLIDPSGDPILNDRKFRAYFGWPGSYFFIDGKRMIVSKAKLEDGIFKIEKVIPEGKKEMLFSDFSSRKSL